MTRSGRSGWRVRWGVTPAGTSKTERTAALQLPAAPTVCGLQTALELGDLLPQLGPDAVDVRPVETHLGGAVLDRLARHEEAAAMYEPRIAMIEQRRAANPGGLQFEAGLAVLHAQLGHRDEAMELLSQSRAEGWGSFYYLHDCHRVLFEPLEGMKEYEALLHPEE